MRCSALKFCTLAAVMVAAIGYCPSPLILAQTTGAATASAAANAKASTYADESIVIERSDSIYTFAADGTGFQDRTIVARVQTDAAVRTLGVISVAYAGNSQHVEFLYARVRHPDRSVGESVPTEAIEMPAPVTREAPFYSDLKEKQLPIRSLRVGDTLEWKARITTTKSEAPGQIWGQESFVDGAVVLAQTIELRIPVGISFKVWSPTAKPVESDIPAAGATPALHVYRWSTSQLKPTAGKEAEAAAEAKKKAVWTADQELDAEQGKLPTIAWTTFKSWEEVGGWYRTVAGDRAVPSAEIKSKVAELIAGKSTEEEKIRALYAYVATQIRYIGVAFGIGRYQPHTAAEILGNQYGDCKDKHTLLAAMLSAAGIPSDAVLIGAGVRFNADVPSPSAFNHLITHLTVAGQPVWLDTTAEIAPYRMLVAITRDKQALIVPSASAAAPYIARTPLDPPFTTFQTMDATGTVDKEGLSHSRLTLILRGDTELIVRSAFHQTSPAQYNELVQQIVHNIGYGGTTSNPDVSRPEDTVEPFKMSFDYERVKAGDWDNYKIIPQVAPVGLPRYGDTDPLIQDLNLGTPHVETSHAAMKIPDGWGAVLPEASHHKCAYVTYDETYRIEKGTIYTERRIEILKRKVPSADLKAYKKWADEVDLGNELFIQLVRYAAVGTRLWAGAGDSKSDVAAAATPATPDTPSAAAAKLIKEAYDDVEKSNFNSARDLLEKANKLSPDQEYYWNTHGYLRFRNGETTEALADYKKELDVHPAAYKRMYPPIVNLQFALGQRKQAADSLRAWSKADPVDPAPVGYLIDLLIADNDAGTAVSEGEAALTRLPVDGKNDNVHVSLGNAYLMAGDKTKGGAMLRAVLETSQDALMLNNAAYSLADASLELPLAESSSRAALDKLTEESSSWTLDEDPQVLQVKSRMIAATWDTFGWTLFREGKLAEAMSFVQASFTNSPSFETGKHVGEMLVARGDNTGAITAYEAAIALEPTFNAMGVHTEPSAKQKQLQAVVDKLRRSSGKTSAQTHAPVVPLRTIPLGPANGRSGNAEYRILFKAGKAVRSKLVGDKTVLGAEAMLASGNFNNLFPDGSHAALVRTGFINCHAKVCELILEP